MYGRYLLKLVILTTAISLGCGGGGGGGTHQDVSAGQLALSPPSLNFGKVQLGQEVTKQATLRAGDSGITVTSAAWSGEGFSVSGISFPVIVPAGQSVSFKVTFAPHTAGSSSGKISLLSDASNSPHQEALSADATQSGGHSVTLSWRSNAANVVGYNIYRGSAAKGPFTKINSGPHPNSSFTDASVQAGVTYFYVTTAVNKLGKESKGSNQVRVTIPNS
jgi:ASPM-SPD-2-Hydin domain-containing protein